MTDPNQDRAKVVGRFYRSMTLHFAFFVVSIATIVIVRTDWPDSRLALWLRGNPLLDVALALWLGSFWLRLRKLNAAEYDGTSKDVRAIITDEWARALRVRAIIMTRVVMVFAQIPLALAFGVLFPSVDRWRAVVGMGVANVALITTIPSALVLYFDREPRDD